MYLISIYVFSPGGGGPLCSGLVLRTPHLNYCGLGGDYRDRKYRDVYQKYLLNASTPLRPDDHNICLRYPRSSLDIARRSKAKSTVSTAAPGQD